MNFNLFDSIRIRPPKRNRFDLSHNNKLTMKFGVLTPILCHPVLPGDSFKLNTEILCRFAPFQAPVMHRVVVYTHFFFVPNRLVWDKWKEFITGGEDGNASVPYPVINTHVDPKLFGNGSLSDYLGFPSFSEPSTSTIKFDALPFRAYQLIYNEYYRDQNLTEEVEIGKDVSGNITDIKSFGPLVQLRKRSWKKDYFTSALPFAQRGDEVELPLLGTGSLDWTDQISTQLHGPAISQGYTSTGVDLSDTSLHVSPLGSSSRGPIQEEASSVSIRFSNPDSPIPPSSQDDIQVSLTRQSLQDLIKGVDLSRASAATINELRRAVKAQEFLEVAARGGSRYIEQIYSYFGVKSSDARLQRPEYLGGGKSPVVISDVLQTSQTTDGNPLATPAGHGVSVQSTHSFKRSFEEHGYIIGIMSVMPMPSYQQGLPRIFQKFDRLDYYWPQFAHLGEQEIKNSEIYFTGDSSYDEGTFGYTPRYAEYKTIPDSVHGDFKGNLSFWHMGRIFDSPPVLNEDFVTNVQDAANRPFSVQDSSFDKIWVNVYNNLKATRLMPVYGTPRL